MSRGPSARPWSGALLVVIALVAATTVAATAALNGVFGDWTFLRVAAIGATGAAVGCVVGARFRLLIGEAIAVSVLLFVLVGIVTCGGPSSFFEGLTDGWADVLSSTPPADLTAPLRAVPLTIAWIGVALGGEIARRHQQPALPAIGPLLTLALAALLASPERGVALALGAIVAAGALCITVVQQRALRASERVDTRRRLLIGGRAAAMLTVVAVAAPFVGQQLPLADSHDRYDLRDQIDPPWDPLSVPSPLVQLKASLKDTRVDDVVFTVSSDTPVTRWQVAVLGSYDGVVWTVAADNSDAEEEFDTVDSRLPDAPRGSIDPDAPSVSATVTIADLGGPWMPSPGWPERVEVDSSSTPPPDVRENLQTGTLALTTGLPAGTTYEVEARLPSQQTDAELTDRDVDLLPATDDLDVLPPAVRNLAADLVEGIDPGWAQVVAVRDSFRTTGFYDSDADVPPGHSYFRLSEFLADPDRIVGYEEQYAAAAGVISRAARLPTRVVVGYVVGADRYAGGNAEVRAGDITAWIEVLVDGAGWVPVDVTPDRSREPTTDQQGTSFEDVAVPNPPPPPQPPPDLQVVTDDQEPEVEKAADDEDDDAASATAAGVGWGTWVAIGAGVLVGFALMFVVIVLGSKARRTHRRRTASSAAHGRWPAPGTRSATATRRRTSPRPCRRDPRRGGAALLDHEPTTAQVRAELLGLVAAVDRASYDAADPDDEAMRPRPGGAVGPVVGALDAGRSPWQRLRMRLDPRPLLAAAARGRRPGGASRTMSDDEVTRDGDRGGVGGNAHALRAT